jgi:dihydrofolate synthase/folylpolyglutamate synthase
MNFDEANQYLLSLGHETLAMKLGLANVSRLLARVGDPQKAFPSVQIAGTNGKGSTAAMLESICRAAGVRAGLFTSPHLVSITERIRIAGAEITREQFAQTASVVREAAEALALDGARPTFFEQVTAIALAAFRDSQVDLAILETGLGGRLDATTAASARVVAITPVDVDHQEHLGSTLREIAAEKAAIIRPGVRAVVAPQLPEVDELILSRARECGVTLRHAKADASLEDLCADQRLRVTFRTGSGIYDDVCLALRGRHQIANAAVAVELAEMLREEGFPIQPEHIVAGLEKAVHAGRLELLTDERPLLLFDGAHNEAGARALRAYLHEFIREPVTLVFGAMRDKELAKIGAVLFPVARNIVLTRPDNSRAATLDELVRAVPVNTASSTITLAPTSRDALTIARSLAQKDGLVCVTGSLYLVGEIKQTLNSMTGADEQRH